MRKLKYGVKGMSCSACVAHVERAAKSVIEGEVTVSLITNSIIVELPDGEKEENIRSRLKKALRAGGYDLIVGEKRQLEEKEYKKRIRNLVLSLSLCAVLMYISMGEMVGLPHPDFLKISIVSALFQLVFTLPIVIINRKYFVGGVSALFSKAPNMDSLIAIGSGASLLYSIFGTVMIAISKTEELAHNYAHDLYFESAAMILALVSLGKFLEERAKKKAGDAVMSLSSTLPRVATLYENGEEKVLSIEEIKVGDVVSVRAGESIPVDGEIIYGEGSIDESALSGESMPVDKKAGDSASASCFLADGYVRIRCTRVGEETSISRIITMLEEAANSKADISRVADKVSAVFVPTVISISFLTFAVWAILGNPLMAIKCAISVMVISCPCALGLATPTAIMVGTGMGARKGILIKSAHALEIMKNIRYVLVDKTGTLTYGKPYVTSSYLLDFEMLSAVYSLEKMSSHPLASAICDYASERGADSFEVYGFSSEIGNGLCGTVNGKKAVCGKPEFVAKAADITLNSDILNVIEESSQSGATSVLVHLEDGENSRLAHISVADKIKKSSVRAVERLTSLGIECVMLTGDNESSAASVANTVGIRSYRASLLPEDKAKIIEEYKSKGEGLCAMVGDGINDAPALALAHVGIAIGAGTEVAIDSADVILSKSSLEDVLTAISISRETLRTVKQNLFWALIYNSIAIPVAAGALAHLGIVLSPMIAAAAMSFSSVTVVLNALRLRKRV